MPTPQYNLLYDDTVEILSGLPPSLSYHNLSHTLDVVKAAQALAVFEGITNANDLLLLRTAALLHDVGFVNAYQAHEKAGCLLAEPLLKTHGYTPDHIQSIQRMIMATVIPQKPPDKLSAILCDADLDYLGRPDFFSIAFRLKKEWLNHNIISTPEEWERRQLAFLKGHTYFTASAAQRREAQKQKYIEELSHR
ncbi:MAG: HD domain-containing protein [Bacteroidetes bacterium]|nr:MAG: HD domain-containing protein [Bacteroidota bacterium]